MDKTIQILLYIFIQAVLIGQMDKIKFHYSESIYSTFKWQNYFNPAKIPEWCKGIWIYVFKYSFLIGFIDFWHALKGVMILLIIWVPIHLMGIDIGLLIIGFVLYWIIFELCFNWLLNKRNT